MLTSTVSHNLLFIEHGPDCADQHCGHDSCSQTWGGIHQDWLNHWKLNTPELKAYLVPVPNYSFPEAGPMIELTCSNHPEGRWLTKGWGRSLHWIGWHTRVDLTDPDYSRRPVEGRREFGYYGECPCRWADLMVVVRDEPQDI